MAKYYGAKQGIGWGYFWQPICVTNKDKALFWVAAVGGGFAQFAFLGLFLGMAAAVATGVPVASTGVGAPVAPLLMTAEASIGLITGMVVGTALGITLAWRSACAECGACFKLLAWVCSFPFSLITPTIIVIPIVALPNTGDCPTIPPGCP